MVRPNRHFLPRVSRSNFTYWYILSSTVGNGDLKAGDGQVEDATTSFDDLALKKKKKSKKPKDAEKEDGAETPAPDDDLDLAALKKKKKKKASKPETDDFDAKLAEAGEKDADDEPAAEPIPVDSGDMQEGTGVWAHDATQPINYV